MSKNPRDNNPANAPTVGQDWPWPVGVGVEVKESMYDFGDGPVPAHKHPNGGGWVADTATVHESAYIGPDATVRDKAVVGPGVRLIGPTAVNGFTQVYEGPLTKGGKATLTRDEIKQATDRFIDYCRRTKSHKQPTGTGWIADTATATKTPPPVNVDCSFTFTPNSLPPLKPLEVRSLDRYQAHARSFAKYPKAIGLEYATLGLTGEAGELANQVKKIHRDDAGKLTEERRAKLRDELGDVLWYVAALATELGSSLGEIASANLSKLEDRLMTGDISGDKRILHRTPEGYRPNCKSVDAALAKYPTAEEVGELYRKAVDAERAKYPTADQIKQAQADGESEYAHRNPPTLDQLRFTADVLRLFYSSVKQGDTFPYIPLADSTVVEWCRSGEVDTNDGSEYASAVGIVNLAAANARAIGLRKPYCPSTAYAWADGYLAASDGSLSPAVAALRQFAKRVYNQARADRHAESVTEFSRPAKKGSER